MPSDDLALILERVDAREIIGEYIALKQTGKTLKALCPFHPEKTPSFNVNPERGLWYCFGCGEGGNLFTFLMKMNRITFPEAKELLAKKAGVTLAPETSRESRQKKRWYEILEAASNFYRQMLTKSAPGEEGLAYLSSRGVTENTLERFSIGMAPVSSQGLIRYLSDRNITIEEMKTVGLATRNDQPRDYFFKRIIFPIWDSSGRVIAFGGRSLLGEQPKYLNSPESPLFKKGENLYAFHLAKPAILDKEAVVLAEGYMDVLLLHQFGFTNSVATLGTSFTASQAKFLSRFAPELILAYDGDKAGIDSMRRAMGVVGNSGISLSFIKLPLGEDPDSFLLKNGADAFNALLADRAFPVDFVFDLSRKSHNEKTPEGKKKIVSEILPILQMTADPVLKDGYINKISQTLHLTESVLRKLLSPKIQMEKAAPGEQKPSREREILSWVLWEPELASLIWNRLSPADFSGDIQSAASTLERLWREGKKSLSELDDVPEETLKFLSFLSARPPTGNIESIEPLIEAHEMHRLKNQTESAKSAWSKRLKEGNLDPTDEAYVSYLSFLRQTKGQGAT